MEVLCLMKWWQHNTTRQSNNKFADKLEVQPLQNQVRENVEAWETASVMYVHFEFCKVLVKERKFVHLLAKDLTEVDWSTHQ